ncbi:MAG TPA: type II CAAX endopeptidase family protein [Verrucomicrobiae bacterium]|jgi:membrane protease YdiL (CAAX protease family)|nr:type II CAAX endopeptidase family protein [Verrucomicrobiae bacterium]
MEPQTAVSPAVPNDLPLPPKRSAIFFNDRGLRAGWRLLIFAGILGGIFGGFYFVALALQQLGQRAGSPPASPQPTGYFLPIIQIIGELLTFLIVLLVTWIMSRIEHRKTGVYGLPLKKSALSQFFTGYVLWGVLPLTVLLLVLRALHVFYFGKLGLHGSPVLYWGLLWGLAFLMVGFFEEFLFRGYALYTLADGIGFWPAAVILAVLFACIHMANRGETRIGIVGTGFFAIFACATLWRTGNLWLAVGAHAGWDWAQSFLYGVNDSGFQTPGHLLNPQIAGPDWLSGGSVGPEGSVVALALWGGMTVIFLLFHRPKQSALVVTSTQHAQTIP